MILLCSQSWEPLALIKSMSMKTEMKNWGEYYLGIRVKRNSGWLHVCTVVMGQGRNDRELWNVSKVSDLGDEEIVASVIRIRNTAAKSL